MTDGFPYPYTKKWLIFTVSSFSVRRLGDDGGHGPPQRIRLCHTSASLIRDDGSKEVCDNHGWSQRADNGDSGQESDYENHPGGGRLRKMAGEVN